MKFHTAKFPLTNGEYQRLVIHEAPIVKIDAEKFNPRGLPGGGTTRYAPTPSCGESRKTFPRKRCPDGRPRAGKKSSRLLLRGLASIRNGIKFERYTDRHLPLKNGQRRITSFFQTRMSLRNPIPVRPNLLKTKRFSRRWRQTESLARAAIWPPWP